MKKITKASLIVLCVLPVLLNAAGIVDAATKKLPESKVILKSITEEKKEQLSSLSQEKTALEVEKGTILKNIKSDIEEIKNKRLAVERELIKYPDDEFLLKKLSLMAEIYDVLNDTIRTWENFLKKITDHTQLLEKYLTDLDLKEYKKNLKFSSGPYFFEDLEDIYQKLINHQKLVDQLRKRKDNNLKEQKNQQIVLEKVIEEYKEKKNEQEEFAKNSQGKKMPFGFTVRQSAELLNLEVYLAKLKKDLAELHHKEKKAEYALVDSELFVETLHLDVLQDIQRVIKSSFTVTSDHIESANQELEKKKQNFSLLKTRYNDEITKMRRLRQEQELRLMEFSKKYDVPLGSELEIWSWQPKKTLESYIGICEIGLLNTYIRLIDDKENLFATLISLEQEKLIYAEEIVKIKETYYKITAHKFSSEDEITQEIKKYAERQSIHDTALKSFKTKKDEVEASIASLQQEILERIKKRKLDVAQQKDTLFKNNMREFALCLSSLDKAEEYVAFRIDIINAINKAYGETIQMLEKIGGYSHFILTELESITIWYRPEYAITWQGVQNIISDLRIYFNEVRAYIGQFDFIALTQKIFKQHYFTYDSLMVIIKLIVLLCALLIIRFFSLRIEIYLMQLSKNVIVHLLFCILQFIVRYMWLLYAWLALLIVLSNSLEHMAYSVFYLLSIPFLLYIAHRFVQSLIRYNVECNYCLISMDFHYRFFNVLYILLYSTICLILLKNAVILANIPKSELPTILKALNFIIFQVAFICLISKEQVLNVIPGRFEMIYSFVNRYYYLLLVFIISIIIMSNPYVGYGRLVMYILVSIIYTFILIRLLMWGHSFVKNSSSLLFFNAKDDVVRERFPYAKTWFGFTILVSFIVFLLIGVVFSAKIWGWPLAFKEVLNWLNAPLLGIGKGTSSPLTLVTIVTILMFIVGGFALAYAFNRFVMEKIFDLMLVESGVQHAITTLIRYLLIVAAVVLGFQSVGYGGLLTYIYVLVLGIGYLIQNPLNDLVAYFIILMQRPIKVGDYIKVDDEIEGIVRKVTPKSVMIRRKNSTTIVVPNAQVINKTIVNWNYARTFIGIDDIMVTISYKADPAKVKDILMSILDAHPNILKNPKPIVRLDGFKEYGYDFMVRGYISSNFTLEKFDIASDIRMAIIKTLKEHGVELAIPMRIMITDPDQGK